LKGKRNSSAKEKKKRSGESGGEILPNCLKASDHEGKKLKKRGGRKKNAPNFAYLLVGASKEKVEKRERREEGLSLCIFM